MYSFSICILISVECAHLRNNTFLKPSPYVELTVDERAPRRTETVKNSSHPKWNETFTLLVTPHSKLNFAVLDHNNFRRDTLIGDRKVDLYRLLSQFGGRCENLEITLDLVNENKADTPVKTGELVCVIQEASSELSNCVANSGSASTLPLMPINSENRPNRSLPDGIRARIRGQSNESVMSISSARNLVERPNNAVHASPSTNSVNATTSPIANGTIRPPATVPNGNVVTQAENEENRNGPEEALPPGWEMRYDSLGRRYYVDHNTRFVFLCFAIVSIFFVQSSNTVIWTRLLILSL